jgi:hypothetical protein
MSGPDPDNEGHDLPYGPPGTGEEAARKRVDAQRLRMDAFKPNKMSNVNESSFYLDAEDLDVDEFLVEPYHLPPDGTAKALFNCYMDTVHSSFPIMPNLFRKNFEHYLQLARTSQPVLLIDKFQAILNLVFAIGAKYSHLTKAEWAGDEGDHHLYMTRAIRLLGLNNSLNVIDTPDLGLIQVRQSVLVAPSHKTLNVFQGHGSPFLLLPDHRSREQASYLHMLTTILPRN